MKSSRAIFILFLLIGFSVFFNGLNGDFIHDDLLVLSHSFFSQPTKILNFFGEPYFENFHQAGLYRPLTQFSFGLNFLVSSSPFGFHLVNIFLHILNSFLVFSFLKRFSGNKRFGLIAALLFLVLPIHVEAVTSIVGRAELLSFFFGIITLLTWFKGKYFLSAITLFLALLSKESAIAVIPVVFLLNWHYRRPWRWLIYYFGVIGLYFILRFVVLGQYAFRTQVEFVFNPLAYVSFFERFFTALKIMILYLAKIFVPYKLSADYSYDQIPIVTNLFSSPLALLGLGILGLIVWVIFRILLAPTPNSQIFKGLKVAERSSTVMVWAWASIFFFFPYLVISNLILPTGTIMAERLMYFPSLGAVMILGLANERLYKFSKRIGFSSLLILLVIYGFVTVSQNRVWASREALLIDSFKKSPNSLVTKTNFGILMLERDKELAKQLSLEVYEKYPDYIQNLNLRAAVEVQEGNFIKAQEFLERALELRSKHQNTLQNLSRVYFTLGKHREAEETLKVLVSEYGGTGNVIFYALVQAKNGHFGDSRQTLNNFFGPEIKDESALKILNKEFEELEDFFIFHKQ